MRIPCPSVSVLQLVYKTCALKFDGQRKPFGFPTRGPLKPLIDDSRRRRLKFIDCQLMNKRSAVTLLPHFLRERLLRVLSSDVEMNYLVIATAVVVVGRPAVDVKRGRVYIFPLRVTLREGFFFFFFMRDNVRSNSKRVRRVVYKLRFRYRFVKWFALDNKNAGIGDLTRWRFVFPPSHPTLRTNRAECTVRS